jgi:molybdopterin converting factor small subunit
MATLVLPVQMSQRAECDPQLVLEGDNVGAVLDAAVRQVPALKTRIYATPTMVNRYLRIFVDGSLCVVDPHEAPVRPASEIRLLTALAGG